MGNRNKILIPIIFFFLVGVGRAETAWYAPVASMTFSSQYGTSRLSMPYRGRADIMLNPVTGAMEFEFYGNASSASTTLWAKSINLYCAVEATVIVSGANSAIMPCQVWDQNKQEVGWGMLRFRGMYNSGYDRWTISGTYSGNGLGLVKDVRTLDQSSISLSLSK